MRILALDHGSKRIGVAVSDETKTIAQPLEYIPAEPFADFLERLKKIRPAPYPTADELKTKLTDIEPVVYKRYVTTYFMQDLFVEHHQRFSLSLVS